MIRLSMRVAPIIFLAWMTGCSSSPKKEDYKIALVASQTKQPGIIVMKSNAEGMKLLTPDSKAQLISASWSPDGNKLAFFSTRPSDSDMLNKHPIPYHFPLYEIDLASGKEKRILDVPVSGFRWSPDGKRMLFISAYEDPGQVKGAIYVVNLQTGEQKRMTSFGLGCTANWSPDGAQIAFSMGNDQASDVYAVGFDGQSPRCLTDSKAINTKPVWSPDGKTIAYAAANPLGAKNVDVGIYVVNPDGANRKLVSSIMAHSVLWSPDGKSLLVQWDSGAKLMDLGGKKSVSMASAVSNPQDVVFAPDGKKILFRSGHEGAAHIYSEEVNGTHFRKLSHLVASAFCLSPLGAK
jgi:Tol biopolymer transport system component